MIAGTHLVLHESVVVVLEDVVVVVLCVGVGVEFSALSPSALFQSSSTFFQCCLLLAF